MTPQQLANDIEATLKTLDAQLEQANAMAADRLDPKQLAAWRAIRREYFQLHKAIRKFADETLPDDVVTVQGGST